MKSLLSAPEVNIPSSRGRASRIQTIKWHCRRQRSGGAKNKGTFQEKGADSVVYVPGNRGQEIGDERNLFTAQHLWFDEGGPIFPARGRTPFCVDGYADGAAKRGPHLPRMSMSQKRRSSGRRSINWMVIYVQPARAPNSLFGRVGEMYPARIRALNRELSLNRKGK